MTPITRISPSTAARRRAAAHRAAEGAMTAYLLEQTSRRPQPAAPAPDVRRGAPRSYDEFLRTPRRPAAS